MAVVEHTADTATAREAARLLRTVGSLADMTAEVAAASDFTTTARRLLLTLLGSLSATRGVIWLRNAARSQLEPSVARGVEMEDGRLPFPEEEAQALQAAGEPILLAEARSPALAAVRDRWPDLVVAVPLVIREEA